MKKLFVNSYCNNKMIVDFILYFEKNCFLASIYTKIFYESKVEYYHETVLNILN